MNKIATIVTAATVLCSFVSCGSKESDKETSLITSKVVGVWNADSESFAGMEVEGMKVKAMKYCLNDDLTCRLECVFDSSSTMYLTDDRMVIDGYRLKISSFDRKNLVIRDGEDEYTFVRTSESSDKYGEYTIPEEFEFGDESTINFESSGVSTLNYIETITYDYNEETNEIRTLGEDDDKDKPYSSVEFDGDDKMIIRNNEESRTTILTREK